MIQRTMRSHLRKRKTNLSLLYKRFYDVWKYSRQLHVGLCGLHCIILIHSYNQALTSAQLGQQKMEELGVAIKRPGDYFAEMVKTDDHMRKVHTISYHGEILNVVILGERKYF